MMDGSIEVSNRGPQGGGYVRPASGGSDMPSSSLSSPSPSSLAHAVRPITDQEFKWFRELIEKEAGIHLTPIKRALIMGRLSRRLRVLGLRTFTEYYRRLRSGDGHELSHMIDRICTNETRFFRERAHFDFIVDQILPRWRRQVQLGQRARSVQVWSAACSTGEEPTTLAMVLLDATADEGWSIDILGTDVSTYALERSRAALWPVERAEEIPLDYLKKYMLRGVRSQEGLMKADRRIRALIRYRRLNLVRDIPRLRGRFDLIFCRNVLIYFAAETRRAVLTRLIERLAPGGFLFLGHAETIRDALKGIECVMPTVYWASGEGGR